MLICILTAKEGAREDKVFQLIWAISSFFFFFLNEFLEPNVPSMNPINPKNTSLEIKYEAKLLGTLILRKVGCHVRS